MNSRGSECPFCSRAGLEILVETELACAFLDRFPVSAGHALLVTKRHVETWFEARPEEQLELLRLITPVRDRIVERLGASPDGWNVGFNAGSPAGQTVMHLHLHMIPRRSGDVPDPRGGIRGVIPERKLYP